MRPKVGAVARITNRFGAKSVLLGELDRSIEEDTEIPLGTHVLILRTSKIDDEELPVIMSEYGTGWVYWDELERIDEVQTR